MERIVHSMSASDTGLTLYFIYAADNLTYWNNQTSAWVNPAPDWADMAVPLLEDAAIKGLYIGGVGNTSYTGNVVVSIYKQAGVAPSDTDDKLVGYDIPVNNGQAVTGNFLVTHVGDSVTAAIAPISDDTKLARLAADMLISGQPVVVAPETAFTFTINLTGDNGRYIDALTLASAYIADGTAQTDLVVPDDIDLLAVDYDLGTSWLPKPWVISFKSATAIASTLAGKNITLYLKFNERVPVASVPLLVASASGGNAPVYTFPVMQGHVYTPTAVESQVVNMIAGDTPTIPFDLGANYAAWTPKFYAKRDYEDVTETMPLRECTWTDGSLGQGTFTLTAEDTADAGRHKGRIILINGDQRMTAMSFDLIIKH